MDNAEITTQDIALKKWFMENTGAYYVYEKGKTFGHADLTRWNKAKLYQKLIGFFFKSYKAKFIDVKSFEVEFKAQLTQE